MAQLNTQLAGVQTALTESLFQSTNVFYGLDPEIYLAWPPADQFVVIQPTDTTVEQKVWQKPSNNLIYLWRTEFTIWLYTRLILDQTHRDTDWLSDTTYGSLQVVDAIINTLQNYTFTEYNETTNYELKRVSWSGKERTGNGWGYTKLQYRTSLNSRSQGQ